MNIDIKVANFDRRTLCIVANGEPVGIEYNDYRSAYREYEQLVHYANQSSSPDWLQMCREEEAAA